MKLKASIDYGIRAIMYLALKGGTCSSKEIAESMSIPRDYLIQLALKLRDTGIIFARPGKNGGYMLAKKPSEISLRNIVNALDHESSPVRHPLATKSKDADAEVANVVLNAHKAILGSFNAFLDSLTVQDLLDVGNAQNATTEIVARALNRESERLRQNKTKREMKK